MKVELVHRKAINVERWDQVISDSLAETLYPYSWYLDAAAENWSALVADNYTFIMPLVWKKKYGLRYLYQPFYTQQLGVFSKEHVDPEVITSMLLMLPSRFRFASINFNIKNLVGDLDPFKAEDKANYILNLKPSHEEIFASFSTNAKRNIKKAYEIDEEVDTKVSIEELLAFKRKNDVLKRSEEEYRWLQNLLETVSERSRGLIYGARVDKQLSAVAYFAFSQSRAIYLVSASNEIGKEYRSMFKLVDSFIKAFAGSELVLDFEGSNIPSVARFFGGFGARPEIYQNLSYSRLPSFLNRIKSHGK